MYKIFSGYRICGFQSYPMPLLYVSMNDTITVKCKKKKKYYMSKKSTSLRKCTTYIDNQWSHKMLFYPFHQKKILPKNSNEYSAKYKSVTMARLFHKWLYFYIHINRNFFFINCWTKKSFPYILNWFSFWVKKKVSKACVQQNQLFRSAFF